MSYTIKEYTKFLLCCFPIGLIGQSPDTSVFVMQVDSLIVVSRSLTAKRDFDKALEINVAAGKIALEKFGLQSLNYGRCCYNHGLLLYQKGEYLQAVPWYVNAIAIMEINYNTDQHDYTQSLHDLAAVYMETGAYQKAELLFMNAKNIIEKTVGKKYPDYAESLYSLAVLYYQMSDYLKAEPLFLEAKSIQETFQGKETPIYTKTIEALAALYDDMGNYEKAEPLFLEVKTNWEKSAGSEDPNFAASLYNLAILYIRLGNYEKAEPLMLEAKDIWQKSWGEEHPDFASILDGLAQLYEAIGNYKKAESYLIQAKFIRQKALGNQHLLYAQSLHNLGALYSYTGDYEKAEPLFLEAKTVQEKASGRELPDYATNLFQLADLYVHLSDYVKAEPLFLESKVIREKVMGKEHPDYAQSLNNLAILYQEMGNYQKAESLFIELSATEKTVLEKALRHLSEKELNNYLSLFSERQDLILSFTHLSGSKTMPASCYDNILFYKGFLLNAATRIKRLTRSDTSNLKKYKLLQSYELRLVKQFALPISERDSLSVIELEEKVNLLEKDLVISLSGYGAIISQVHWQEVKESLHSGEAALEFVTYDSKQKSNLHSKMYAALLLRSGDTKPSYFPLFEEKQLDSLLKTIGGRRADYVNNLYSFAQRGAIAIDKPQKTLYDLLWLPLQNELEGVSTIYFSPSGLLHRLNIGAIAVSEDQSLADKYHLVQLKSTRQLVIPDVAKTVINDAILFGGIKFDLDSNDLKNSEDVAFVSRSDVMEGDLSFANSDSSLRANYPIHHLDMNTKHNSKREKKQQSTTRGGTWTYLPGTEKEIIALEKLLLSAGFNVMTKKGSEATEEEFKTIGQNGIPSPRILHLATHGYFFPDPKNSKNTSQTIEGFEPVFKISDHPMLRSGLILAGGNSSWEGANLYSYRDEGKEDGILTAYEISQMNLSNTELVVLSACETGLGDIQGNEGVYGLQRAFKIAGVKYLIMSLWQVPDKQTSELMKSFYQKWIIEKLTIPEAFRLSQKEMRERFVDPYAWAGFVLVE